MALFSSMQIVDLPMWFSNNFIRKKASLLIGSVCMSYLQKIQNIDEPLYISVELFYALGAIMLVVNLWKYGKYL